jgi:hypothetical protein
MKILSIFVKISNFAPFTIAEGKEYLNVAVTVADLELSVGFLQKNWGIDTCVKGHINR